MASELNMYESQVQDYKYDIERLSRELQDVKKKYFLQKKREQQQRFVITAPNYQIPTNTNTKKKNGFWFF